MHKYVTEHFQINGKEQLTMKDQDFIITKLDVYGLCLNALKSMNNCV